MVNIFSTISNEEKIYFDGCFATDMFKVNGKPCVYPCFLGFNSTSITIVQNFTAIFYDENCMNNGLKSLIIYQVLNHLL